MTTPRVNAVLVDDAPKEKDDLIGVWTDIFRIGGFDVNISYEMDFKRSDRFMASRPHFVLVDNHVMSRENAGVEFIAENKPLFPDVIFILFTGNTFSIDSLANSRPNPDLIVTKTYIVDREYQEYLGSELRRLLSRCTFDELSFDPPIDFTEKTISREEIRSIVERCLIDFTATKYGERIIKVQLKQLTDGLSGNSVFRMTVFGSTRYATTPFVLKVGHLNDIRTERDAFRSNVRFQLPHDMRVDAIGYAETAKNAGIAYAFALGNASGVKTANEILKSGDSSIIELVKTKLFQSNTVAWYRLTKEKPRLKEFFFNQHEYRAEKDSARNEGFNRTLREIANKEGIALRVTPDLISFGTYEFQPIKRTLSRVNDEIALQCHSHGDLNANNIFADAGLTNIAIIDFEYTGENHVFKDFVSFEASIRALVPDPLNRQTVGELIEAELRLNSGRETVDLFAIDDQLFIQLAKFRSMAFTLFPDASERLYRVAAMLHHWKLLGLPVWAYPQKLRLAASLVATLVKLRE
jgi:Phosphotransferase enzyme family